jgi:hypothetical protein
LFIVLSLFILYLFLMGYVPASFSRAKGHLLEQVALTIAVGILINYCLILTGQTITRVFAAGIILALWGVLRFVSDLRIRPMRSIGEYNQTTVFSVLCVTYILFVYYFEILSEPLLHSDARFIWFFHARMIWAEGALRLSGGWNHPSLAFSNPDYPELVPAIAAQLGYLKGYWNEFLPKGSLLVMLVPLTLWVFSFCRKSLSFIWLVLIFFFSLGAWLWNGYMDGYLALYCGVALLLFGRYLSERRDTDLYSGICALGIGASIKNEGLLFGLCVIAALLFISREDSEFRPRQFARRIRTDALLARVLLFSIAPTVMWAICQRAWGLRNDLANDPLAGLSRLLNRLADGSTPGYLLNYLTVRATAMWLLIGLFAVLVMFSVYQRSKMHRGALVAAMTSALYFCGIYLVYLSTPHDILDFYLLTSGTRTMATACVALFVSMFFLLSSLEVNEAAR